MPNLITYINNYFDGIVFQKARLFEKYTDYICPIINYNSDGKQKYVIVSVMNPDAKIQKATIHQLRWFSICTTENLNLQNTKLKVQNFFRSSKDGNVDTEKILTAIDRDYERTIYCVKPDLPVRVILLHNLKEKSQLQFPDNLSLHLAVDTFNCIVKRTDF